MTEQRTGCLLKDLVIGAHTHTDRGAEHGGCGVGRVGLPALPLPIIPDKPGSVFFFPIFAMGRFAGRRTLVVLSEETGRGRSRSAQAATMQADAAIRPSLGACDTCKPD